MAEPAPRLDMRHGLGLGSVVVTALVAGMYSMSSKTTLTTVPAPSVMPSTPSLAAPLAQPTFNLDAGVCYPPNGTGVGWTQCEAPLEFYPRGALLRNLVDEIVTDVTTFLFFFLIGLVGISLANFLDSLEKRLPSKVRSLFGPAEQQSALFLSVVSEQFVNLVLRQPGIPSLNLFIFWMFEKTWDKLLTDFLDRWLPDNSRDFALGLESRARADAQAQAVRFQQEICRLRTFKLRMRWRQITGNTTISKQKATIENFQQENRKITGKAEEQRRELVSAKKELEACKDIKRKTGGELDSAKTTITEQKARIQTFELEIAEAKGDAQWLKNKLRSTKKSLEACSAARARERKKNERTAKANAHTDTERKSKIVDLKKDLQRQKSRVEEVEGEMEKTKSELSKKEARHLSTLKKLDSEKGKIESSSSALDEDLDAKREELGKKEKEIRELKDSINELDNKLEISQEENKTLQTTIDEQKENLQANEQELEAQKTKIVQLESSKSTLQSELNAKKTENAAANARYERKETALRQSLKESNKKLGEYHAVEATNDEETSELQGQVNKLKEENGNLQPKLRAQKVKNGQLERSKSTLLYNFETQKEENESRATFIAQLVLELKKLQDTIQEKSDDLDKTEAAGLQTIQELKEHIKNLKMQAKNLRVQLEHEKRQGQAPSFRFTAGETVQQTVRHTAEFNFDSSAVTSAPSRSFLPVTAGSLKPLPRRLHGNDKAKAASATKPFQAGPATSSAAEKDRQMEEAGKAARSQPPGEEEHDNPERAKDTAATPADDATAVANAAEIDHGNQPAEQAMTSQVSGPEGDPSSDKTGDDDMAGPGGSTAVDSAVGLGAQADIHGAGTSSRETRIEEYPSHEAAKDEETAPPEGNVVVDGAIEISQQQGGGIVWTGNNTVAPPRQGTDNGATASPADVTATTGQLRRPCYAKRGILCRNTDGTAGWTCEGDPEEYDDQGEFVSGRIYRYGGAGTSKKAREKIKDEAQKRLKVCADCYVKGKFTRDSEEI